MRRFHSYGPVNSEQHFCVARTELVNQCLNQLLDGSYFTIWAARQTGKTWLMRQVLQEISQRYGDKFALHLFSIGNLRGFEYHKTHINEDIGEVMIPEALSGILAEKLPGKPQLKVWKDFVALFNRQGGLWDRPVILLIDEVDSAPPMLLDLLVGRFRELYLDRASNWLHGLALTGVRAVVGLDSPRGSPFNIQRSLHVPNFSQAEVLDLYQQYQQESQQEIEAAVVEQVYTSTRGQPGLVSWFGELLTEKHNPAKNEAERFAKPITMATWYQAWNSARYLEPNNTVMNLVAKARDEEYQPFLLKLFNHSDIPFLFHDPLHNYLYTHGLVEPETVQEADGGWLNKCRFSSPFIQDCLYDALSRELVTETEAILPLHPLDELTDVFEQEELNLPALLTRYQDYLVRLKAKGINPWKSQPRRQSDFHLTEAVGHFHLYAWLKEALSRRCVVSPEFPTGNGKVDLHIRCGKKRGIIEIKSFVDMYRFKKERQTAATYAKRLGLPQLTMAVFVPLDDEEVLAKLSGETAIDGVQVITVAISWT